MKLSAMILQMLWIEHLRRNDFVAKYNGKYMAMGDGEPLWVSDTIGDFISEMMSSMYRGIFPYFTIKVVPEGDEIELFDVYEKYL